MGARLIAHACAMPAEGASQWLCNSGLEHVRVLEEEGQVRACLLRIPMGQHFGGRAVPMIGIAGVAVAPEWRGRGTARRLMEACVREVVDAHVDRLQIGAEDLAGHAADVHAAVDEGELRLQPFDAVPALPVVQDRVVDRRPDLHAAGGLVEGKFAQATVEQEGTAADLTGHQRPVQPGDGARRHDAGRQVLVGRADLATVEAAVHIEERPRAVQRDVQAQSRLGGNVGVLRDHGRRLDAQPVAAATPQQTALQPLEPQRVAEQVRERQLRTAAVELHGAVVAGTGEAAAERRDARQAVGSRGAHPLETQLIGDVLDPSILRAEGELQALHLTAGLQGLQQRLALRHVLEQMAQPGRDELQTQVTQAELHVVGALDPVAHHDGKPGLGPGLAVLDQTDPIEIERPAAVGAPPLPTPGQAVGLEQFAALAGAADGEVQHIDLAAHPLQAAAGQVGPQMGVRPAAQREAARRPPAQPARNVHAVDVDEQSAVPVLQRPELAAQIRAELQFRAILRRQPHARLQLVAAAAVEQLEIGIPEDQCRQRPGLVAPTHLDVAQLDTRLRQHQQPGIGARRLELYALDAEAACGVAVQADLAADQNHLRWHRPPRPQRRPQIDADAQLPRRQQVAARMRVVQGDVGDAHLRPQAAPAQLQFADPCVLPDGLLDQCLEPAFVRFEQGQQQPPHAEQQGRGHHQGGADIPEADEQAPQHGESSLACGDAAGPRGGAAHSSTTSYCSWV